MTNNKIQINSKSQKINSKVWPLNIGICDLFGSCDLELEIL